MPNNKITYSSELMVNFRKSTTVAPQQKFQALQTPDGYALLFSIGTDHVCYVTQQSPGLPTGWQQVDLSSRLSAIHNNRPVIAKTFAVSQNLVSKKFSIALAITVDGKDYLYLSLGNLTLTDNSIPLQLSWTAAPYDDPDHPGLSPIIEHLYIAQGKKEEFLVVDISRRNFEKAATELLERYYIDQRKPGNRAWNNMARGGDVQADVSSRLGRRAGDKVDGIYSLGTIGNETQLLYAQVYNPKDRYAPPFVGRFQMPPGATAIAVADTGAFTTDLFVAADRSLYFFAAYNQDNDAAGQRLLSSDLFANVTQLYAYASNDIYVVWGLNQANQVFYTSCRRSDILQPQHWTIPMPILSGVTQVSPYLNAADTSNTFFAIAGNKFQKAVQSTMTSLWDFQDIALQAPPNTKAEKYSSYTTRIQLTDEEDRILPDTALKIRSSSRSTVYINQLYYVLTPEAITVRTDVYGCITVVEAVQDLSGVRLFVKQENGAEIEINPMDKPFKKLARLDSAGKLKDAAIEHHDGTTKKLISSEATDDDLQEVARANASLSNVYNNVSRNALKHAPHGSNLLVMSMPPTGNKMYLEGVGFTNFVDVGNIFRWLETGVSHIIQLVHDTASNVWRFVVTIAGKIYQGVLDCVEKVVGAVKWIYEKIKTAIEDLIKFLEFLFQWKDFQRTKDVLHNFSSRYIEHEISRIPDYKKAFDGCIQQLIKTINDWAGITDWQGLGETGDAGIHKKAKPAEGQTAPGALLSSHYENNAADGELQTALQGRDLSEKLVKALLDVLVKEGEVFANVISQFQDLAVQIPRLSLKEVLQKIAAIFAGNLLKGFQHLADALFDIIHELALELQDLLHRKIRIPVVSDILEYFGVPSLSALDLMCWITAIPATLASKLIANEAPFKDDSFSRSLINAPSLQAITDLYKTHRNGTPVGLLTGRNSDLYFNAHLATGIATTMLAGFTVLEALDPSGNEILAYTCIGLGVIAAAMNVISGIIVPKHPIENEGVQIANVVVASLCLLNKGIFSKKVQSCFADGEATSSIKKFFKVSDPRSVGAIVDGILAIIAAGFTGYHFHELSQKTDSKERNQALIEEGSNVAAYLTRISYAGAVNKVPLCAPVLAFCCASAGGLHIAAAIVEKA